MAIMSGLPDRRSVDEAGAEVLPLPDGVSELLPQRGIARGTILGCSGARSLLVAVIATITRAGGQVGIVGLPWLNLLAAAEMGADLDRVAVVADPGIDPVEVAAVLLDGMDLVVLGLRGTPVPPSRGRVIGGRARQAASVLLVVDGDWPGVHAHLRARVLGYRQVPAATTADLGAARSGYGRVAGMRLRVVAEGRDRRRRSIELDLVAGGGGDRPPVRLVPADTAIAAPSPAGTAVAN
ncbi:MAG: hypothetical protein QM662_00690 [Gordonia sp. (in: high G+C Gram-positive bacteria)]